nr:MAG TPA: Head decoration protein [Caudoviricetes sp.]
MPKLNTKKILAPEKTFLAFPDHYVNVTAKIAYSVLKTFTTTDPAGNKALLAGQVVALADDGTVTKSAAAASSTKATGNAIVFNTVRLDDYTEDTDDYVNVTVLVHGFVRKDRLKDAANLDAPLIHVIAQ